MLRVLPAAAVTLAFAGFAAADTAYVKPSTFAPMQGQTITAELAFNDDCCEPKYAVRADTFAVVTPDGVQLAPDRVDVFATQTVLEHKITETGTTRFSTGERLGRKGEYVQVDGQYYLINSPDAEPIEIPEGTPILTSQTATSSDAYVTVGDADWQSAELVLGRLTIRPETHPNTVEIGQPFFGQILFDGAPVPAVDVVLTNEAQRLYAEPEATTPTDTDGRFELNFGTPGVHLIMVRMQAPAPAGAETDIRSYTTSLTLNVPAP